ncbi:hypothetical protein [Geotalea sp. SG265]|uniref:hypothetical protein n=1 Tax=Geotalea sp. SG265 TaxID=2922867 RepID=UPI001FAFE4BD|nr:hypothetical protein [Geotalea sp. SG265]
MRKIVLIAMVVVLPLSGVAHALPGYMRDTKAGIASTSDGMVPAGVQAPSNEAGPKGMAGAIQKAHLPGYPKMTIGQAFGKYGYLENKEWRETRAANGDVFIDFTGYAPTRWFDFKMKRAGISARGLEVKFVVHPDGAYEVGMVSSVEVRSNGSVYRTPRADIKNVLDAIYGNQRLKR